MRDIDIKIIAVIYIMIKIDKAIKIAIITAIIGAIVTLASNMFLSIPKMSVSPDTLNLDFGTINSGEIVSSTFLIANTGGGTLTWNIDGDKPWITVTPKVGTNSDKVTVNINTAGLSPGTYTGTITISSNAGTKSGSVRFIIKQGPSLSIYPDPLYFDFGATISGKTVSNSFSIKNTGGGTLTWNIDGDKPWITVTPKVGTDSGKVTVNINTVGLSPGTYTGTITISSNAGTKSGSVRFIIKQGPRLSVSLDPLSFDLGTLNAGASSSQSFTISNAGDETLTWSISADQPWITVNPTGGTNSGTVTININTARLSPGTYTGTITISSNAGTKSGSVRFILKQGPRLSTYPDPLSFDFGTMNAGASSSQSFTISNAGDETLTWSISADQPSWITVNPTGGTNLGTVTININTASLSPGRPYTGTITISSNAGTKTGTINLNVIQAPQLSISPYPLNLDFGTLSLGRGDVVSKTFSIKNTGGGTLESVVAVHFAYMGLTITPKDNPKLGAGEELVVTVTIDANGLKNIFSQGQTLEEQLIIQSNGGNKTGTYRWSIIP
jgi:hypothetical protein